MAKWKSRSSRSTFALRVRTFPLRLQNDRFSLSMGLGYNYFWLYSSFYLRKTIFSSRLIFSFWSLVLAIWIRPAQCVCEVSALGDCSGNLSGENWGELEQCQIVLGKAASCGMSSRSNYKNNTCCQPIEQSSEWIKSTKICSVFQYLKM